MVGNATALSERGTIIAYSTVEEGDEKPFDAVAIGFQTIWASDADAALKLLEQNPDTYAAALSDVVMPGMNGVELGREIARRQPDCR